MLPLRTRARERRWARPLTLMAGVLLLIFALWGLTNRGLNTSFEHTEQAELAVSEQLVKQV